VRECVPVLVVNLLQVFREIGAIEPLKRLASGIVQQAARFASQALQLIGEEVPLKLSPQVPLWTSQDVIRWLHQVNCSSSSAVIAQCRRHVIVHGETGL